MVIVDPQSKDCEGLLLCKNLTTTVLPTARVCVLPVNSRMEKISSVPAAATLQRFRCVVKKKYEKESVLVRSCKQRAKTCHLLLMLINPNSNLVGG